MSVDHIVEIETVVAYFTAEWSDNFGVSGNQWALIQNFILAGGNIWHGVSYPSRTSHKSAVKQTSSATLLYYETDKRVPNRVHFHSGHAHPTMTSKHS